MDKRARFLMINSDGIRISVNSYGDVTIHDSTGKDLRNIIAEALLSEEERNAFDTATFRAEVRMVIREIVDEDALVVTPNNIEEIAEKYADKVREDGADECKTERDSG